MGPTLTPILSSTAGTAQAYNPGMAETYSWVPIVSPDLGRPLYARASYITNFSDMSVNLSAGNLSIGAVTIKDNDSGLNADVVNIPGYGAGLQVLTQDLESDIDDVTIGDKNNNYAAVDPNLSALNVKVTNAETYTLCETKTAGDPSFTPRQVLLYNPSNSQTFIILTLTSGLSCRIPMGKHSEVNHIVTLNLAVSAVNNYAGCEITFFA